MIAASRAFPPCLCELACSNNAVRESRKHTHDACFFASLHRVKTPTLMPPTRTPREKHRIQRLPSLDALTVDSSLMRECLCQVGSVGAFFLRVCVVRFYVFVLCHRDGSYSVGFLHLLRLRSSSWMITPTASRRLLHARIAATERCSLCCSLKLTLALRASIGHQNDETLK